MAQVPGASETAAEGGRGGATERLRSAGSARDGQDPGLRPLRILSADLPDLPGPGKRDGLAAGPDLPDALGGRGARRDRRQLRQAHESVPGLPRLRDRLSVRGRVRPSDRSGAGAGRTAVRVSAHRPRLPEVHPAHVHRPEASPDPPRAHAGVSAARGPAIGPGQRRPQAAGALGGHGSLHAEPCRTPPWVAVSPRSRRPSGTRRGRVALLLGCAQHAFFPDVNLATARVLAENGFEVVAPAGQGCCGSLFVHEGEREHGKALARRAIEVFEATGADFVAINAAGCGSVMKDYGELLKDDPDYGARAAALGRARPGCVRDPGGRRG